MARATASILALALVGGCDLFGTKTTVVMSGTQGVPSFVVPAEGSTLTQGTTLAVRGTGLDSARFSVDGRVLYDDTAEPFEWVLDPRSLTAGSREISVSARRGDLLFTVSTTVEVAPGLPAPPPQDPPLPDPPAEDPPVQDPPATDPIQFVVPAEGATVTSLKTLLVQGTGIEAVVFKLDGAVQAQDFTAPFEWVLDPAAFGNGAHTLVVEATRAGATETRTVKITIAQPATGPAPTGDVAKDIAALRPGEWYEIRNTRMEAVYPSPLPPGNPDTVIGAWSSAVYDTKRDRLLVWGGGSGDYGGNEIYSFSLKDFRWTRLTDPSPFWPGDTDNSAERMEHPDGAPFSRHTYDTIEYVPPPVDSMFCAGGDTVYKRSLHDPNTWLFRVDTLRWNRMSGSPARGTGSVCAVDADGIIWAHGTRGEWSRLCRYDPATDTWTKLGKHESTWYGNGTVAEIDPGRKVMVAIGAGQGWIWDLTNPAEGSRRLNATGETGIQGPKNPGIAYDPVTRQLVAWNGGASVYTLDLDARRWSKRTTTGRGTTPPAATGNGTFGRWRYVPSLNVFVNVNDAEKNVFVYRHAE